MGMFMRSVIYQGHVHVISHSPRPCSCVQPFTKGMFMCSAIHQGHVPVFSHSPRACSCVQPFTKAMFMCSAIHQGHAHVFRIFRRTFYTISGIMSLIFITVSQEKLQLRHVFVFRPFKRTECISPGVGSSVLGLQARDCSSRRMCLCSDKRQCGRLCDGKRDCSNGEDKEFCRNVLYYVDRYKLIESATH